MTADDLKKFCADADDIRYYLCQPWTRDGFTYATNGCIGVRVPAIDGVADNEKAPDFAALMNRTQRATIWFPVPETAMPDPINYSWCDGKGRDPGDRRYKCHECGGKGKEPDRKSNIEIGGTHFAKCYLALIQGWEIAPNYLDAAWIRHGDAIGLLMPMRV